MNMPVIIPDVADESSRSNTPSCHILNEEDRSPPQQTYLTDTSLAAAYSTSQQTVESSIRRDRERDGRCGDCGLQTHEFRFDILAGSYRKVPLTVDGEVHRGRCLLCLPVSSGDQNDRQGDSHHAPMHVQASIESMHNQKQHKHSTMRRRVSGLTSSVLGLIDPCDATVLNALHSLIDGNNDIVDILFAMKRVPHDPVLQERGCERLWILSWEDENAISIGRVGGISIILSAMAQFPANSYLQQCGCESIQNLALNEYNRREIAELGGLDLIVQCMISHSKSAGVQQSGCTALASMAATQEFCEDITTAGGPSALLLAARHFAEDEVVLRCVQDACQALGFDLAKGSCSLISLLGEAHTRNAR